MNLSKHLTLEKAVFSETAIRKGISNQPTNEHLENLKFLGTYVDTIKEKFPDVTFNSIYRSKELNKAIGGSLKSFHSQGAAVDMNAKDKKAVFDWIRLNMDFTELIYEFGDNIQPAWVHFAIIKNRTKEKEILKAISKGGKTTYVPFV